MQYGGIETFVEECVGSIQLGVIETFWLKNHTWKFKNPFELY